MSGERIILDPTFSPAARTNLVPTPNPDSALGSWSGTGSFWNNATTLTRDTAVTAPLGLPGCLKSVSPGTNNVEGFKCAGIAVTAGVKLRISIYVRGGSGGESAKVGIGDGTVGTASSTYTTMTTAFQRISFTFTPTASGNTGLAVIGPASKVAQTLYAAAAVVEVDPGVLYEYFPTPRHLEAPFALDSFAWLGVPYESQSTYTPLRTELDITPWVKVDGIDWGEAEMEAYKAEAQVGESVLDYRLPNRQIVAPLVIKEAGGTSFAKARSYIQAKAARYIQEGGIGKRVLSTGGTVYFDIVANGLTLGGDWLQANQGVDVNAELRMEAIPDFYEPEELIAEAEEKTAAELITVIPDPGGDMPARVRTVVEDKQGQAQCGLIWSFRSRHYSAAVTAKPAYEAEELGLLGAAVKSTLPSASNGTAVTYAALPTLWTPVVSTSLGGTTLLSHQGTYRVYARMRTLAGAAVSARLVWDIGDFTHPSENAAWAFPAGEWFYIADLGEVRLNAAPFGPPRWQGQIQARSSDGAGEIGIDKLWFVNTDEGWGQMSSPIGAVGTGFSAYSAQDDFNHSAGALTGKTLPAGGTWAGIGDADDFNVDSALKTTQRTSVSDTGSGSVFGRGALAGTATYSDIVVEVELQRSSTAYGGFQGLISRYTNSTNYLLAAIHYSNKVPRVAVFKFVAGVQKTLGEYLAPSLNLLQWMRLRLLVTNGGQFAVWLYQPGSRLARPVIAGQDGDLASGNPLASGRVGMYDENASGTSATRSYDGFVAWVSNADAVVFASQKAQIATEGMYRLVAGGSAYGPISRVIGDLPRLPAGGLEGKPCELFLKSSRGDFDLVPDMAIDDLAAKVYVSRSWLQVPSAG